MKIRILNNNYLYDYREFCKVTVGEQLENDSWKPKNEYQFWLKQCYARHSTLRAVHFRIVDKIPRSVAMQLVRHTDGHPQPEVESSRPDWTGKPRSSDPCELKLFAMDFTPESFRKMAEKRLCGRTEKKTQEIVKQWVCEMRDSEIPLLQAIARVCMPRCEATGKCYELKGCGKYPNIMEFEEC